MTDGILCLLKLLHHIPHMRDHEPTTAPLGVEHVAATVLVTPLCDMVGAEEAVEQEQQQPLDASGPRDSIYATHDESSKHG